MGCGNRCTFAIWYLDFLLYTGLTNNQFLEKVSHASRLPLDLERAFALIDATSSWIKKIDLVSPRRVALLAFWFEQNASVIRY
jgi:hypothetical protein